MAFQDHAFLILGGSGGIGSALTCRIVAGGGRVTLVGRSIERLRTVAAETGADFVQADVCEPNEIDAVVKGAIERMGRLDGAANCVGSILLKPAHLTTDDEWADTIHLNLTTSFRLIRAFTKVVSGAGSLVFFSTVAARVGLANHEAISAAKAGVQGLALSAAATYAARGLRVNCVAPGLVRTPLAARITGNEAALKASTAMHPLGRIGDPEDVAAAAVWLLDPANSWVTGQVIGVDGGLSTVRSR